LEEALQYDATAYKRGEAPFKDYWSDDTKNNYREESSRQ
jgi:hypothetical protein